MESEKIYQLGKIHQEKGALLEPVDPPPANVQFAFRSNTDPEFALSLPCRVLSFARYTFDKAFSLKTGKADVYAVLYVYEGALSVRYRHKAFRVGRHEAVFLHLSELPEIRQEEGKLDVLILHVSGYLSMAYYQILHAGGPKPIAIRDRKELDSLFSKMQYYMQYPTNLNHMLLLHAISGLFTALYMEEYGHAVRDGVTGYPKWFTDAVAYLEENYSQEINIQEFVRRLPVSESQFFKQFKAYAGESPYQYLVGVRLNHAERLLTATQFQVKYIAAAVGFASTNHFIRQFKKKTGLTPVEFRRRQRGI